MCDLCVCVVSVCVVSVRVVSVWREDDLCVCCLGVEGGGGRRPDAADGRRMRDRKEEPHTKMWGTMQRPTAGS